MADSSNEINYNAWSDRRAKNKPQRQREENVEEPYSTITSNLDSFLVCTTPMVQRQFTPQASSMAERWKIMDSQCISFFSLADLWDAYDEWSAYGAGVPLYLPTEQVVVQYYVPYLSALQIYARDSSDFCSTTRKFGEESDFSDLNSEASIDMGRTDTIWDASTQSSEDSDEAFYQKRNNHGQLLFEYFERISPCGRAPLADKISELSHQFSKLKSLRSHELSPASWVSVAWYPIYRIPTGVTMKDMEACFLTFHSLSTAACLQGGVWDELELGRDAQIPVRVEEEKMMLPVFGLASYKLRGAAWSSLPQSERRRAWSLMSCADAWLKQLHVHHPDFHFFASSTRRPK